MIDVIFTALSFFAVFGAIFMVISKEPMSSALSFIVTLLSLAGIFAVLSAPFLFLVQIIVYAGAIITLLLLIIMLLNIKEEDLPKEPNRLRYIIISTICVIPLDIAVLKAVNSLPKVDMNFMDKGFGSVKSIGMILFKDWLLPFELVSILLIVSLIGAIVFAKRKI